MAFFLLIETSSPVCSVSIANEDGIITIYENNLELKHAALAPQYVHELLVKYAPDAVALSAGPGSYTGLRIGTSLAKGICFGKNIPLIAVSTLRAMADGMKETNSFSQESIFVPMLDARRMEVYTAAYDYQGNEILPVQPILLNETSFEQLQGKTLVFFGSGSEKAKLLFSANKNNQFIKGFQLSSKYLLRQTIKKYKLKQFENLGYFEPYYLKDFLVTTSNKKFF